MFCRHMSRTCGLLFIVLSMPGFVESCPSCNLIEDPIARGFNWGIIFLMSMPFVVFGTIGGGVYYSYYRKKSENDEPRSSDVKGV